MRFIEASMDIKVIKNRKRKNLVVFQAKIVKGMVIKMNG